MASSFIAHKLNLWSILECNDVVAYMFKAQLSSSGVNATHNVVYQNEEGQWVTDLAYYSSFEKEVDGKTTENTGQFQTEDFVSPSTYQIHHYCPGLFISSLSFCVKYCQ